VTGTDELLARVQAIGAPLAQALADGRCDVDGDEPSPPVEREVVALAMRRLLELACDIESGIYPVDGGGA
jgi:hypothetical protein